MARTVCCGSISFEAARLPEQRAERPRQLRADIAVGVVAAGRVRIVGQVPTPPDMAMAASMPPISRGGSVINRLGPAPRTCHG